jgi:hypothetical protein
LLSLSLCLSLSPLHTLSWYVKRDTLIPALSKETY